MLPTSPQVAEEITRRGERRLLSPSVRVDWDDDGDDGPGTIDDLTGQLAELTISREITTALPAAVRQVVTGSSAASCTVTLKGPAHEDRLGTVRYWSDSNPSSPLAGKPREHRPAEVAWRFITPNDVEQVPAFVGKTRDAKVDRDGPAEIEVLDLAEDFRGPASLPLVLADDQTPDGGRKPGLDGGWLIDYLARQRGYHASPPARPESRVVATMHGSAYPEVGDANLIFSVDFEPINFAARGWNKAAIFGGNTGSRCEYTAGGFTWRMDPTRQFYVEGWVEQQTALPSGRGLFMVTSGLNGISLFINNNGNLAVYLRTPNSGPHITNTALNVGTGVRRYVALHVAFGTNTATITVRRDATSATFGTPAGFDNTTTSPQPQLITAHVARSYVNTSSDIVPFHGFVDNVQFGEGDITGSFTDDYSSPHTIQPSLNRLYVVPAVDERDAWALVQDIASAEFGVARFTTEGHFQFLNRQAFSSPPFNQVQRTLTTSTAIKALSTDRAVDTVRNHVIIRATPVSVLPERDVWKLTIQHIRLGPAGQPDATRTFAVSFDWPVYNLDLSVEYAGGSIGDVTGSRYRAAQSRDGTGGAVSNLTWTVTPLSATFAAISVSNPNPFEVWVVQPQGIVGMPPGNVGRPAFSLVGSPVLTDQGEQDGPLISNKLAIDRRNPTSIAEYGEQVLRLDDSPWRQDLDSIEGIADHLRADLGEPSALLEDIPIVGDPRLEPLDLVQLQDPDGFVLDAPFRLYKVETDWRRPVTGAGGEGVLTQTVTVRSSDA